MLFLSSSCALCEGATIGEPIFEQFVVAFMYMGYLDLIGSYHGALRLEAVQAVISACLLVDIMEGCFLPSIGGQFLGSSLWHFTSYAHVFCVKKRYLRPQIAGIISQYDLDDIEFPGNLTEVGVSRY